MKVTNKQEAIKIKSKMWAMMAQLNKLSEAKAEFDKVSELTQTQRFDLLVHAGMPFEMVADARVCYLGDNRFGGDEFHIAMMWIDSTSTKLRRQIDSLPVIDSDLWFEIKREFGI